MISDVPPDITVVSVIFDGCTKSSRTTVEPTGGRGAAARLAAIAFPILQDEKARRQQREHFLPLQ